MVSKNTKVISPEVIEAFKTWQQQDPEQRSLYAAAQAMQVSEATMSLALRNQYTGRVDKLEDKIKSFLQLQKERELHKSESIGFVKTFNAEKIHEVVRLCHVEKEIGVISGDAGLGKTYALKEYVKKYPEAILVEADLGYSAKVLFRELCGQLGLDDLGLVRDLFDRIMKRLKNSNRILIIDEAEHLPFPALDLVRRLNDKAGIGIILAGMPALLNNLRGRKQQFRQLYSRVGISYQLDNLRYQDVKMIVELAFPKNNGSVAEPFYKYCKGNARHLSKLIARSQRVAQMNKREVDEKLIAKASELLII